MHIHFRFFITAFSGLLAVLHVTEAQDKTPPIRPYITYVTVDTGSNDVEVYWSESPSPDVEKYYVYYEILTVNGYEGIKLDSVPAGTSHYVDATTLAGEKSLLYSVTAIDSSGNESLRKPGLHSTVHTKTFYDSCNNAMVITWNKYTGWDNNVSGYRIYGRENSGNYQLLNGNNAGDTTFTVSYIKYNTHYYFYVEGLKNDGLVSRSNIAHKYTYAPEPPDNMLIEYATVLNDQVVELKFSFSATSEINDFALLRSSIIDADFSPVKYMINVPNSPLIIQDSILTSYDSYFYKVGALNSCSFVIDTSNLGCNILLSVKNLKNLNTLKWSPYIHFPAGIQSYEIYREDNQGNFGLIGTVSPSDLEYTDDISGLSGQGYTGKIGYLVRAIENTSGNISASNICRVEVHSEIFLPNAFTPNQDGKNDEFRPVMNFIPEEYLLLIYNRYGIVIFKSTDYLKGWDGTVNGNQPAAEGVYTYHIEYTSYTGQKKVVKPGSVTLFYP